MVLFTCFVSRLLSILVDGQDFGTGSGNTKRLARIAAATAAMIVLIEAEENAG